MSASSGTRVLRRSRGRLRLHVPGAQGRSTGWLEELQACPGVLEARLSERTENVLVAFDPAVTGEAALLTVVERGGGSTRAARGPAVEPGWLRGERSVTLAASAAQCVAVLLAFEGYPAWQQYVAAAEVLERDRRGRGVLVRTRGGVGERELSYVTRYRYPSANRVCFEQADGELDGVRGSWSFRSGGPGRTRTTLVLEVKPGWRLGLMLRGPLYVQVRDAVLDHLLGELRERVEGGMPGRAAGGAGGTRPARRL